ncbi:hypothetical protein SAMN04487905_12026 [Actinopolyspora xinjiangensis]|uniref:Uncharacterized protein n=1 Tax=Actinopolyspora xinjiangensis TaxID=405564 RepID=A0A1H0X0I1_9ACTN|nr:hypothetical protein SAMN04487905_12026 [Actinopolyspora xinjiangensis]
MNSPSRPHTVPEHAEWTGRSWFSYEGADEEGMPIFREYCPSCGEAMTIRVNGRCRACHEASLLPVSEVGLADTGERWSEIYLGISDE